MRGAPCIRSRPCASLGVIASTNWGPGAILVTSGMLLLVYAIVKAPEIGWSKARTVGELAGAGALLAAFALNEPRHRNPLFPFSISRTRGLAAANATQMIAIAGFYSMFFLLTLYMQNVLGYSPIQAGSAWLPTTFGVAVGAGICTSYPRAPGQGRSSPPTNTAPVLSTGSPASPSTAPTCRTCSHRW
jgi:hypothetical protein